MDSGRVLAYTPPRMWIYRAEHRVRVRQRDGYGYTVLVLRGEHAGLASDARLVCLHDTLHGVWSTQRSTTPSAALLEARSVWRVLTGWCQAQKRVWSDSGKICEANAVLVTPDDLTALPAAHMRNSRGSWLGAGPWPAEIVPEHHAPRPRTHMEQPTEARAALVGIAAALGQR